MKTTKQKKSQPKKVLLGVEDSQVVGVCQYGGKQMSGHTKISTNCTIYSNSRPVNPVDKSKKSKKSVHLRQKSAERHGLPTSKSNKNLRIPTIDFASKQRNMPKQNCQNVAQPSCREYCLVDSSFVPLSSTNDELIKQFLIQTASSSCDFSFKKPENIEPARTKLRRKSIKKYEESIQKQSQIIENTDKFQKIDRAVSSKVQAECQQAEIEAIPEMNEIGMQYSQRKTFQQQKNVIEKTFLNEENSKRCSYVQQNEAQSISDLLFKLQFSHLGNQNSFKGLSSNQKQHFSQVLETVINKLKTTKLIPSSILKPIVFEEVLQNNNTESIYSQQKYEESELSPKNIQNAKIVDKQVELANRLAYYERLQGLICLRQCHQMNWVQQPANTNKEAINTSLFTIINFLCHMFCYIQVEYSEQFLYLLRKMYGLTYRQKYKRISRGLSLTVQKGAPVVDQAIFLQFINENNSGAHNQYEAIHLRAVFQAFNEHLQEYKPFYQGNGEQFPWALKMFKTMSQYSIDEDSLQIIFRQAKEKIVGWASTLCGIIVQQNQNIYKNTQSTLTKNKNQSEKEDQIVSMSEGNPLHQKRNERQNRLVLQWLSQQDFEKDGVENYSTGVLHQTAQAIYTDLFRQAVFELTAFF